MNEKPTKSETDPRKSDVPMPKFGTSHKEVLMDRVGRKIVGLRKARSMSQTALARASSVPTSVIFSAENGLHNTSLITLAKIAAALGVELRDLMPDSSMPASAAENRLVPSGEQQGRPAAPIFTGARSSAWKAVVLRLFSRRWRS